MRRRRPQASKLLFLLSVLVAVAASLVLKGHLARLEAAAVTGGEAVTVVVAAESLERGVVLAPPLVRLEPVPMAGVPPNALRSLHDVVGRTLGADVAAGEVLTPLRLAPPGGPIASLVPDGLRAVPVATSLPPGTVVPGDRVDVVATFATGRPHVETVLRGVEVLRVLATEAPEGLGTAQTVMLLVDPSAVERLAYARAFADLSVSVVPSPTPEPDAGSGPPIPSPPREAAP